MSHGQKHNKLVDDDPEHTGWPHAEIAEIQRHRQQCQLSLTIVDIPPRYKSSASLTLKKKQQLKPSDKLNQTTKTPLIPTISKMPELFGHISTNSGVPEGRFPEGEATHIVRFNVQRPVRFDSFSAKLTYDTPDIWKGPENIRPDSYVGTTDLDIELEGPEGTASITGELSYPVQREALYGSASWSAVA
ncbi:hypothetical protein BDV25DRAFT_149767 [Aspergillus avenaceus]|uniref:Uncharacterized protein n=1 Tax=Aspergillus avenaceus TaxID=36643 RepID=A0A5N6U4E3_ASPAV|nr:hypothetical protein BDV25DRAFT_149767 [Aspergillus avenaceus]